MANSYATKLFWALAVGLLAGAILGATLIGERMVAALFNSWEFADSGHWQGIDLGARSSLQFLFLCLLGTAGCFGISHFHRGPTGKLSKIVLLSGVLYICAGTAVVAMISTGFAYLYCGR